MVPAEGFGSFMETEKKRGCNTNVLPKIKHTLPFLSKLYQYLNLLIKNYFILLRNQKPDNLPLLCRQQGLRGVKSLG